MNIDRQTQGALDAKRIDITKPTQVTYWSVELGCTAAGLIAAVQDVGPTVAKVRGRLRTASAASI